MTNQYIDSNSASTSNKKLHVYFVSFFILLSGIFIFWGLYKSTLDQDNKFLDQITLLEQKGAIDFELPRLDGTKVKMSSVIKGHVVILNFWASWCDSCLAEFPSLLKLIEQFKGRVILLALTIDQETKDIDNFFKIVPLNQPFVEVLRDPSMDVSKLYGTTKLPETYIFDKNGKLARKIVGTENWTSPQIQELIQLLISSPD